MALGVITFQGRSHRRESQPEVSLRSVACATGFSLSVFAQAQSLGAKAHRSATHPRCNLLLAAHGLPVADATTGIPLLEYGLRSISPLANYRSLATNSCRFGKMGAKAKRQETDANHCHPGFSIDSHGRRGRRKRLRFRQENHRSEAAHCRGYPRDGSGARRSRSVLARLRRSLLCGPQASAELPKAEANFADSIYRCNQLP